MNTVAECITYCRKKVAERVVPYTGGDRALEIVIEGRGMTPQVYCPETVETDWAMTMMGRAQAPDFSRGENQYPETDSSTTRR